MKKVFLLTISLLFANQMSVDGGLNISGQVNASSFSGDGSALTNLPSLGGMKPDRIYYKLINNEYNSFTVPDNKMWFIELIGDHPYYTINGVGLGNASEPSFIIFQNNNLTIEYSQCVINIYEYSISGSGTDQGMDYIIP